MHAHDRSQVLRCARTDQVRLKDAAATALQEQQEKGLPELSLDMLPLPLEARLRYACGSVRARTRTCPCEFTRSCAHAGVESLL